VAQSVQLSLTFMLQRSYRATPSGMKSTSESPVHFHSDLSATSSNLFLDSPQVDFYVEKNPESSLNLLQGYYGVTRESVDFYACVGLEMKLSLRDSNYSAHRKSIFLLMKRLFQDRSIARLSPSL